MPLWQPTDAVGAYAWYKAKSGSDYTLSGSTLTAIADKTGLAHGASQGTRNGAGFSTTGFDGTQPAFTFAGGSSQSLDLAVPSNMAKVAYAVIGNFDAGYMAIFGCEDITNNYSVGINGSNQLFLDLYGNTNIAQAGSVTRSTPQILVITRDVANALYELRLNGTVVASGVYNHSAAAGSNNHILGGVYNRDYVTGAIGDVVVLNDYDNATLEQVEGYMAWDWGYQSLLPTGHTYKAAAPTVSDPLWTPTDLGTQLSAWYDASDAATITQSGGVVSQWNDKTANANHLTQATSGSRPTYQTAVINGRNTVRFDGSDDWLTRSSGVTAGLTENTAVTISAIVDPASGAGTIFGAMPSGGGGFDAVILNWGDYVLFSNKDATNTCSTWYGSDLLPRLITGSGLSAGPRSIYLDGAIGTTDTPTNAGASGNVTNLDAYYVGANGLAGWDFYNGDIGEIVVCNTVLSTGDREKLDGYLAWKWGTQSRLPVDHPYKSAAPIAAGGAPAAINVTAAQTTSAVTQTSTVTASLSASAAQTLSAVAQTSSIGNRGQLSASQTTAAATQTSTAGVVGNLSASQPTLAATQSSSIGAVVSESAAQTLAAAIQTSSIGPAPSLSANQVLSASSQTSTADVVDALSAAQTLWAVTQTATAAAINQVSAAQVSLAATQVTTVVVDAVPVRAVTANQDTLAATQTATISAPIPGQVGVSANQNTLAATQAATITVDLVAARAITAAQTLDAPTQTSQISAPTSDAIGISANQTLSAATQTSRIAPAVAASAAQSTNAATQTSSLIAGALSARDVGAAQTTLAAAQTSSIIVPASIESAQTTGAATQTATATTAARVDVVQTLTAATQTSIAHVIVAGSANQMMLASFQNAQIRLSDRIAQLPANTAVLLVGV